MRAHARIRHFQYTARRSSRAHHVPGAATDANLVTSFWRVVVICRLQIVSKKLDNALLGLCYHIIVTLYQLYIISLTLRNINIHMHKII